MMKYILKIRKVCALLALCVLVFCIFGCVESDFNSEDYDENAYESEVSVDAESNELAGIFDNYASESEASDTEEQNASEIVEESNEQKTESAEKVEDTIDGEMTPVEAEEDTSMNGEISEEAEATVSEQESATQTPEEAEASDGNETGESYEVTIPSENTEAVSPEETVGSESAQNDSSLTEQTNEPELSENQETPKQEYVAPPSTGSSETMVWIPTVSGKRYHSKSTCSKMIDPSYVTISEAKRLGFTPCGKCYK